MAKIEIHLAPEPEMDYKEAKKALILGVQICKSLLKRIERLEVERDEAKADARFMLGCTYKTGTPMYTVRRDRHREELKKCVEGNEDA